MIEITVANAIDGSAYNKALAIHHLKVLAWIDNNLKSPKVQAVMDWEGERVTDSCTDYYHMVEAVQREADSYDIGYSRGQHEAIRLFSDYIMAKKKLEKETMAAIKREKIAKLKKELAELDG